MKKRVISMTPSQRRRAVSSRLGKKFLQRLDAGKILDRKTSNKNTRRYTSVPEGLA